MQDCSIEVNHASKAQVMLIGREQTPVMIFDDFALDTAEVKYHACDQSSYDRDASSYYPGVRAALPRTYVITALQTVYQQVCALYKVPQQLQLQVQPSYYSLLTFAPQELSLLQRLPHFDTSKPYYFAVLHYLNDGPHGATGFFRDKASGFERVSDFRVANYLDSANEFIKKNGEPEAAYFTFSNAQYELYHQIEYRPNRLVIYPGNLLHSTIVDPQRDIDDSPATGRLTANMFIDFQ
jgi:hypothetical protein